MHGDGRSQAVANRAKSAILAVYLFRVYSSPQSCLRFSLLRERVQKPRGYSNRQFEAVKADCTVTSTRFSFIKRSICLLHQLL